MPTGSAQFKSTHSKAEESVDTRKTITMIKLVFKLYCDSGQDKLKFNEMIATTSRS
ncbi:hypothetical protein T11_1066 [Trichinella zimbabwensis]|uniref:Uncharacterized protein n=1 Tax=Trichinella zimbabwensis TaxID=268475 RepID=A0A0V1DNK2_9BILA|nr:hypothetical protein T11_1066 [Trichinella zimbabwensis]